MIVYRAAFPSGQTLYLTVIFHILDHIIDKVFDILMTCYYRKAINNTVV